MLSAESRKVGWIPAFKQVPSLVQFVTFAVTVTVGPEIRLKKAAWLSGSKFSGFKGTSKRTQWPLPSKNEIRVVLLQPKISNISESYVSDLVQYFGGNILFPSAVNVMQLSRDHSDNSCKPKPEWRPWSPPQWWPLNHWRNPAIVLCTPKQLRGLDGQPPIMGKIILFMIG